MPSSGLRRALERGQRLLDAVDPAVVTRIEETVAAVDGVVTVTEVRARWMGHRLLAQVRLSGSGALGVIRAQEIAEVALTSSSTTSRICPNSSSTSTLRPLHSTGTRRRPPIGVSTRKAAPPPLSQYVQSAAGARIGPFPGGQQPRGLGPI